MSGDRELALIGFIARALRQKPSRADFVRFCMNHAWSAVPGAHRSECERKLGELRRQGVVMDVDGRFTWNKESLVEFFAPFLADGIPGAWATLAEIAGSDKEFLRKFDNAAQVALGAAGEEFVIRYASERCSSELQQEIIHVSKTNDAAGYDIRIPGGDSDFDTSALEVKTSVLPGESFSFYISRNEFEVCRKTANWYLVGVRRLETGFEIVGYLTNDVLSEALPDIALAPNILWETLRVQIEQFRFRGGLPGLLQEVMN